jgi:hypothetical protein
MKIAVSLATFTVIAAVCAGNSASVAASTLSGRSLVDRCMSEPVSNDHLSCGGVYRQAYVRTRLKTKASAGPRPSMHRHVQVDAARFVRPKPSSKFARARTVRIAHAIVADKRQYRDRTARQAGTYSLASATPPLVVLHPRERTPTAARLHQASALCSRPAYRSSWECGRYFLLAPYAPKTR